MKVILVNEEIRKNLRSEFKVSDVTIRRALSGKVSTLLHVRIRDRAIALGGAYKE